MKPISLIRLIFIPILLSISCVDIKKDFPVPKNKYSEQLNGMYTGNFYKWNRDYDSTHSTIIETYDTLYNVTSELIINEDSNTLRFGGVLFEVHDDLAISLDTIHGLRNYSTLPYTSIKIIKSIEFIQISESAFAPSGPWTYKYTQEYFKD